MSGRLIILPKKSYCPWKPENVERILRDERLERERVAQEQQQQEQYESKQRMDTLKGRLSKETNSKPKEETHVNLFETEERAAAEQTLTGTHTTTCRPKKSVGIHSVMLGGDAAGEKDEEPFYKRQPRHKVDPRKEQDRKARLDPMKRFVRHDHHPDTTRTKNLPTNADTTPNNNKTSNKKRARSDDSDTDSSSSDADRKKRRHKRSKKKRRRRDEPRTRRREKKAKKEDSLAELRRRRLEREQHETQRQAALLHSRHPSRRCRYQDQYNPHLSRR